jgi:hypothetical protein
MYRIESAAGIGIGECLCDSGCIVDKIINKKKALNYDSRLFS